MTIYMALAITYDVVLAAICLYAWMCGGVPERFGAGVNLGATALSSVARVSGIASWAPAQWIILSIDILVAFSFYQLATRTTRFWPIWALGFALADIFASVAGRLLPGVPLLAYETGLAVYAYLALFSLAIGTARLSRQPDHASRSEVRSPWCLTNRRAGSTSASSSPEP